MVEQVDRWLQSLGLGKYAQLFAENEITIKVLPRLTDADLKELGLPLGPRRILSDALQTLASAKPAVRAAPTDPSAAKSTAESIKGQAERRQLTVMFVDLVGSTALAERLDPEDMGVVLRAYQNAVAGEILRLEGHVAKFMGDGVLAYFGWPRAHEDEAERAVRAGLAIVGAVARLTDGTAALACRIGIATGLVVVGELIGEGVAQEQTVVGDTPNLAARLQTLAAPGQVVIAPTTRRLLGAGFKLDDLGAHALKGIEGSVGAFSVTGERVLVSRFEERLAGLQPMVGRDQELAMLLERWSQAEAGEGQAVLLVGEAGVGKSRISRALLDALGERPHLSIRYQCSPYHTGSALWPAIQQLEHTVGFAAADPLETRLDKLEAALGGGSQGEVTALIAGLLGLDGSARYGALELAPPELRARTLEALVRQLVKLAATQPVLLLIEDAHWADPTTLELIEGWLDAITTARVLLVVTSRPDNQPALAAHPHVTRMALNRLGREATAAIMTRVTRGKTLPAELVAEIAARTDGVPLYVEEMTKAVLESGALRETDDAWLLDGPLDRLGIPTSLHDSLMARLDRQRPVKQVAQTAAVIGRSFDHRTIAALAGLPETELTDAMQRLVEAELVFRRGTPPDASYLFKHALVRDAAYESLLKSRRQELHGRLFDLLEQDPEVASEILAQHAEAAGRLETALDAWEKAGRAAVARPAFREAIAAFSAGVRLCGALGRDRPWLLRELALRVQMGQALMASDGYQGQATLAAFERAQELADAAGEPALQLPAAFGLWAGRYIAAAGSAHLADRFASLAAAQNDSGPQLIGIRVQALERFHAGRLREALALAERSLALYRPEVHGDLKLRFGTDPAMTAGIYRTWCLWHLGWPDQAAAQMDKTLAWARTVDHANTTGLALCSGVALTSLWLRRPERAERTAREALQLAEKMSLALWHARGLVYLGAALFRQGKAAGIEEIEAGLAAARQIGAARFAPFHLSIAAEAYAQAGHHGEAAAAMAQAFGALEASGDRVLASDLHRVRAAVALRIDADARSAAETDLARALELARAQEARSLELRAARDLARLWAERGERQRALDLLAPIHGWFTEGLDLPDLVEAKSLLDALQ